MKAVGSGKEDPRRGEHREDGVCLSPRQAEPPAGRTHTSRPQSSPQREGRGSSWGWEREGVASGGQEFGRREAKRGRRLDFFFFLAAL